MAKDTVSGCTLSKSLKLVGLESKRYISTVRWTDIDL